MIKKILKISAFVLGIVALGLIYYYFFFAKTDNTSSGTNTNQSATNFFPFGQGGDNTNGPISNTEETQNTVPQQTGNYLEKLRLISGEPVAGATFVENKDGVYIRYMEKATGHIFDVATFSTLFNKISNTTIPKIYEAYFTNKGTAVIARYTDDDEETIQTVYAKIASTTTGTLLPSNIQSVAISPSGSSLFYIQKTNINSTGIISLPSGGDKRQIWDSRLKSVLPQFAGENQVLITTKPHASAFGYAYIVNTKTASVKNILGSISDLSTLINPTGNLLLYWTSDNNGGFFTYSLSSGTTTMITPKTLPEKCVFDPNDKNVFYCAVPNEALTDSSLDDWYLGLVSFSDDIWKYNIANNSSVLIEGLKNDSGRDIDATNLQLNSAGSILIFTSKIDGSLWSLTLPK